jgi:hypothetical protein
MGNPDSDPEFRRTCPACNRPVRPGYKFCEICGTRIPSLLTCSKCGTQFIHPKKYCDLCGAPFILEEIQELAEEETPEQYEDDIPEPDAEEGQDPAEEETPEQYEDDIPEPDAEEGQDPAEEETPKQYEDEIQEPDTDELLEKYGTEYGYDETLESSHKPKPRSPVQHEAKKPVTVPVLRGRGSSATVDDALFLIDKKPVPAKHAVTWIRIIGGGIALIIILAAVFFIGLPMLTSNGGIFSAFGNPAAAEITHVAEPAIARTTQPTLTVTPPLGSRALIPLPTELVPTDQKFYFQIQKNPITSKISIIFIGSASEGGISSADIRVTHMDGSVTTGVILPLKGVTEVSLDGSKETDRVEIIAKMSSGETYRVYDDLLSSGR